MFLLEEFIYNTKMKYNYEVIKLQSKKQQLIEKITSYNKRITEINKELVIDDILFVPKIDIESEFPEKLMEVSN